MKFFLTILLLHSVAYAQSVYHVSNSGSNANSGSLASPFATINHALSVAVSGDSILLERGSTFTEALLISNNNLKFNAYGTGAKPVISGFQAQTGFTNVTGNVWRAVATNAAPNLNMVLINDTVAHKGRNPNAKYLIFTSFSGDSSITGTLTGNYTGYEMAVKTVPWMIEVVKITNQTGGKLDFTPHLYYPPQYGANGYFLQNDSSFVDTLNEYSFNNTTKSLIVYSSTTPTVIISTIDTLVNTNYKTGLSFSNIQFEGANKCLMPTDSAHYLTIKNCNFLYSGWDGIYGHAANNITIQYDTLINILNNAVGMVNDSVVDCDAFVCTNNYIKNTGMLAGMGRNGFRKQNAITVASNNANVSKNRIDNVGYVAISWIGKNSLIKNNYITNFCLVKSDGAAIYSGIGSHYPLNSDSGSIVRANIVSGGHPNVDGTINSFGTNNAAGYYIDESVFGVLLDSNTTSDTYTAGLFNHNSHDITMVANTVIGGPNGVGYLMSGPTSLVYNNISKHNLIFASPSQYVFYRNVSDYAETMDSNYYSRWPTEGNYMYFNFGAYTLAQWKTMSFDAHSSGTPADVTYDEPLFYTNPFDTVLTIDLGQTYMDLYGHTSNSVSIQPYKSALLFKAINQIPPTPPPTNVFTSLPSVRFKIKSL